MRSFDGAMLAGVAHRQRIELSAGTLFDRCMSNDTAALQKTFSD
jgi:hypothetical protein